MSRSTSSIKKAAKKAAKKNLQARLFSHLKELSDSLNIDAKKSTKEILKASKKLAKKLAKDLKPITSDLVKTAEAPAPEQAAALEVSVLPAIAASKPTTSRSRTVKRAGQ